MRLLKRHSDEETPDDSGERNDDGSVVTTDQRPDRVVERRPPPDAQRTAETEAVEERPGRDRWFRRTETVPLTVPRRSLRQTMTIPRRRIEPTAPRLMISAAAVLAGVAGAALAVVGIIALIRTEINDTWFRPVVEVLDADHTPLLGAIELGAGVLLLVLGLTGSRVLVAMAGMAGALVATAAAVEPQELARELAIESWWAWVLAGVGVAITLVALWEPRSRPGDTVIDVR